jgi:hypothetical protein
MKKEKDAMDWEEDPNPFHLTHFTQYEQAQQEERATISRDIDIKMEGLAKKARKNLPKRTYNVYTIDQKVIFLYYLNQAV